MKVYSTILAVVFAVDQLFVGEQTTIHACSFFVTIDLVCIGLMKPDQII